MVSVGIPWPPFGRCSKLPPPWDVRWVAWVRATPDEFCCRNRDGQARAALEATGSSCIEWIGAGGRAVETGERETAQRLGDWDCDWDWPRCSGEWESAGGESGYERGFRPQHATICPRRKRKTITIGASGSVTATGARLEMKIGLAVERKKKGRGRKQQFATTKGMRPQ